MPHVEVASLFIEPDDDVERAVRRVKGTLRRRILREQLALGEQIPDWMMLHDLPPQMKDQLSSGAPHLRSGEDLPDLAPGEVEVARLTLTRTVHQEVTSLRAVPAGGGAATLRMVDEYEEEAELPFARIEGLLSLSEVVDLFVDAEPSPVGYGAFVVTSDFFDAIDDAFASHRDE